MPTGSGTGSAVAFPSQALLDALSEAGLHLLQQNLDLARDLAACTNPAEAVAASIRWSTARMDQALADQARLMAAFLACSVPAVLAKGEDATTPP
jgi:hypothetical protein